MEASFPCYVIDASSITKTTVSRQKTVKTANIDPLGPILGGKPGLHPHVWGSEDVS